MNKCERQYCRRALTLIEIMVVVGIIAILAGILVFAGGRYLTSAQVKNTRQLMKVMASAMDPYKAATGGYPAVPYESEDGTLQAISVVDETNNRIDYFQNDDKEPIRAEVYATKNDPPDYTWNDEECVYGIQAWYYKLNTEPECRQILSKGIPQNHLAAPGTERFTLRLPPDRPYLVAKWVIDMNIEKGEPDKHLHPAADAMVVLDSWGNALYYGQDQNRNNGVPYFQSAGPDGIWNTDDDLFSDERGNE